MNAPKKMSLRKKGREDIKKYYELKFSKLLDALILLLSLVGAGLVLLPVILIMIQLFEIYAYLAGAIILLIFVCMLWLMLFNGISNFLQIELAKMILKDEKVREIDSKAVFVYECTNIGFFFFLLAIILMYACVMLR